MKDGNYLIGLLTHNSVSVAARSSLRVGLGPHVGLTLFTQCLGDSV